MEEMDTGNERCRKKIDKATIDEELEKIKEEYKDLLDKGKKSTRRYPGPPSKLKLPKGTSTAGLGILLALIAGEATGRNAETVEEIGEKLDDYNKTEDEIDRFQKAGLLTESVSQLFGIDPVFVLPTFLDEQGLTRR
jgi:hypothetical protein